MGLEPAQRSASYKDEGLVFDPAREGFSRAFERYADLYSPGSDVTATGPKFYARVDAQLLPGMAVFSRTLHEVEHRRERRRIVRDGFEHFTIHLVDSGKLLLDADGVSERLLPGDAVLVDMTRPFRSLVSGRLFTLSVSRERLSEMTSDLSKLHGARLANDDGRLRRLLTAVDLADSAEQRVEELASAVSARIRADTPVATGAADTRRERALRFIEDSLASPQLAPARIATEAGMSRASLYRAFAPLGGVANWIQTRRLLRVRVLLARTTMSISEAGRSAGFPNASHLTSAFQARFGCTPSAYRQSRAAFIGSEGSAAAAALSDIGAVLARVRTEPAAA